MPILAVIAGDDCVSADPARGGVSAERDAPAEHLYNPNGFFEKVYLLSPFENREAVRYGLHTIPTQPGELPERLRALGVDIVRAYGGGWPCDMACGHKARGGGGVPVVVSVQSTDPAELSATIRKADYVLCPSEAVRELVLTRFPDPERVWVLSDRFYGDERLALALPGQESVARFEQRSVAALELEVDYYRRVLAERPIYRDRGQAIRRAVRLARGWVPRHTAQGRGVYLSSGAREPNPGATGCCIPTLLDWGETRLAEQYARWLVRVQHDSGAWGGPAVKGPPHTSDTGSILKGLLAIHERLPEVEPALLRSCQWLAERVGPNGAILTPALDGLILANGRRVPGAFHLCALPPLAEAAGRFRRPDWAEAVARAIAYYVADPHLTDFATLSHFHACIVEALVDLGQTEAATRAMDAVERLQRLDGSVPGWPDVDWVCSSGLAQYALVWLKIGRPEPARRAFAWLVAHQNRTGGFLGSTGDGADYFPNAEIAWAVKAFLDVARRLA